MPDTGAPYFIPFADPTDLVRDWPALSEDVAEAVADGLDAAGGLVAVKHVLKTDTFVSGSVAAGDNVAVPDLSITHAVADAANRLIITAYFGVSANSGRTASATAIAVMAGATLLGLGDADENRTRVGAGGRFHTGGTFDNQISAPLSVTFVHAPNTTDAVTYTVRIFNLDSSSSRTLYVNRNEQDIDSPFFPRGSSALVIQEVKV